MQARSQKSYKGHLKFFRLNLSHEDLFNYYKTNFVLVYDKHFSLNELEDMMPWERDVYISLLENQKEEEKKKRNRGNLSL